MGFLLRDDWKLLNLITWDPFYNETIDETKQFIWLCKHNKEFIGCCVEYIKVDNIRGNKEKCYDVYDYFGNGFGRLTYCALLLNKIQKSYKRKSNYKLSPG